MQLMTKNKIYGKQFIERNCQLTGENSKKIMVKLKKKTVLFDNQLQIYFRTC